MTVVVANLEKRELVIRVPDEKSLRISRLSLTRKGKELVGNCQRSAGFAIAERLRIEWPESEARAIVSFLEQVCSFDV
jgi:DNA-binding MarR family transcriptional regulator